MISFRYHLVSIVAVFLALALGVLMGTTVVKQSVIDNLTQKADSAVRNAGQLRQEIAQLQTDVRSQQAFARAIEPAVVNGRLTGEPVVMVTVDGVDPSTVDGVRKVLEDAGASIVALLVATPRMALTDPAARRDMGTLLGAAGSVPPAQLATQAADALGARLAEGPAGAPSDTHPTAGSDLLGGMLSGRFLALRAGTSTTAAQIGGADQVFVMLSGNPDAPSAVDPALFLTPLISSVLKVSPGRPVVAAETTLSTTPFLHSIRSDAALDGRLVTVDDADVVPGQIAVAFGLHDLRLSPGDGGDFGVNCGSCSLLPSAGP